MHYDDTTTLPELLAAVRERYPVRDRLNLQFGDCNIKVEVNQASIKEELIQYFGAFVADTKEHQISISVHEGESPTFDREFTVKQPDPGKSKIKEEFIDLPRGRIVRKRLTGMHFVFGEGLNLAVGPCMENLNQVINFINNRYIEWELSKGSLLGHAAAVTWKEKGIAIAGFSGAGKSTLSLQLMSKGTDFISNDRLMVNLSGNGLVMRGVAKLPRINPGTILNNEDIRNILSEAEQEEFSALPDDELWQLEYKFDVPIEECFGKSKFILKAPMNMLAILNWKRGDGDLEIKEVNLAERRDLLPAFMKSTGLFFLPHTDCSRNDSTEEDYIAVLKHCRVIEFSGAVDFEKAADACLSFIENGHLEHVSTN